MQTADDVKFGDGLAPAAAGRFPDLFQGHGVRLGIAYAFAERAQPATGDAHVGRVDVAVYVEVGDVAADALANQIGEPADAEQIGGAIQGEPVLEAEAL